MSSGALLQASRTFASDVWIQAGAALARTRTRWLQATPRQRKLVIGALALAAVMVVALYLTLHDSIARVERKLAADADLAKWSRFCTTLSKAKDRQQCLVEVQARRVNTPVVSD